VHFIVLDLITLLFGETVKIKFCSLLLAQVQFPAGAVMGMFPSPTVSKPALGLLSNGTGSGRSFLWGKLAGA